MQCTRCHTSMTQSQQETTDNCQQTWYICPVCAREQHISRRVLAAGPVQIAGLGAERVTRAWAGRE